VFDFPNPATQDANIAATTSLTKMALLQRAAESPAELTDAEATLLRDRYWLDLHFNERGADLKAIVALKAVSQEHYDETVFRLDEMRAPLYVENEGQAIANAYREWRRRILERARRKQAEEQAEQLARLEEAGPWLRQLWNRVKDRRPGVWDMLLSHSRFTATR
jgi:hypothetical protein